VAKGRSMKSASRTLVKSQPELWELIDQPSRMQGLMSALLGRATEVTVNEREPESILCWEAAGDGGDAWIKVELAEKSWGTHVEVSADNPTEAVRLDGWLDAVLDELATPEKRPFGGMAQKPASETMPAGAAPADPPPTEPAPAETTAVEEAPVEEAPVEEAPIEEAPPVEEAPVEEAPVEEAPVEEAPVEEAPVEPSIAAPPAKKRRRFLIF
jgi:hypothetical protein